LLDDFMKDVRYAARGLRGNLALVAVALLTLALGIGANTAIFSVINAVLLRGLPVHDPQQLVYWRVVPGQPNGASNTGNGDSRRAFGCAAFLFCLAAWRCCCWQPASTERLRTV
jgi:hypothetical protein